MPDVFDGSYDDFDGVSVLFDPVSVGTRYGRDRERFDYDVVATMTGLVKDRSAVAFGTRAGGSPGVVVRFGAPDGLDCGVIRSSGALQLAGWHAFTYACDCAGGVVETGGSPRFGVPEGWYAVSIARVSGADEQVFTRVTVTLTAVSASDASVWPSSADIAGADGYF